MQANAYVYVLKSIAYPCKLYIGLTNNLERRIEEHNDESQIYSRRYAPWQMATYIAFCHRSQAAVFEKYLKTPSGKAFLHKHLLPLDKL